jgi:subtilisin-like proprotein convertase family protein
VSVTLTGVTSPTPSNLDVLLVSPDQHSVLLMSDAGGTGDLDHVNLSFGDGATGALPQSEQITTGNYKPSNYAGNDGALDTISLAPPEPPADRPTTFAAAFSGGDPNGEWDLYVIDDETGGTSTVAGWSLTVATSTGTLAENAAPLTPPNRASEAADPATAAAYPSQIDVADFDRELARVTVTLHDVNLQAPRDMDLLLVGPTHRAVLLISDVGSPDALVGGDLTIDDAARFPAPLGAPLKAATYQPADDDSITTEDEPTQQDIFPAPAPTEGYRSRLSVFKGTNPNGTWRLYMTDDFSGAPTNAVNGGWSLNLTPSDTPLPPPPAAPVITSIKLKPRAFALRKGTLLTYKLSVPARMRFTVERANGVKLRGSIVRNARAGSIANRLPFHGVIGGRRLKPGRYRFVASPAGGVARRVAFTVKPGK